MKTSLSLLNERIGREGEQYPHLVALKAHNLNQIIHSILQIFKYEKYYCPKYENTATITA